VGVDVHRAPGRVPLDGPGDADLLAGGRVAVAALVGKGLVLLSGIDAQPGSGPGGLGNGGIEIFSGRVFHRASQAALQTADTTLGLNDYGFHSLES